MRIHRRLWESGNAGKRHISIIRMEPQSIVGSRCGYRKSERGRKSAGASIHTVCSPARTETGRGAGRAEKGDHGPGEESLTGGASSSLNLKQRLLGRWQR